MTIYEDINVDNAIIPWWILNKQSCELVTMSNIISLIRKERVRHEPEHYYAMYMNPSHELYIKPRKYNKWKEIGYVWPNKYKKIDIINILLNFPPEPHEVAEIIKD